ncbi:unnamed protein product [marine sediment metagenome]|uniref:Uncharacterized protein n=1 Tax=marine sediment metagenome TaxID=412755 RepID=X1FVD7_9ZZZZ
MEYTEHYDNLAERETICKDYANQGLRCLHDNFDEDWKRGDEPHGTLIFTDVILPTAEPVSQPTPDEARLAEIVSTSPQVITMPDMWEAIRILARIHNIGE